MKRKREYIFQVMLPSGKIVCFSDRDGPQAIARTLGDAVLSGTLADRQWLREVVAALDRKIASVNAARLYRRLRRKRAGRSAPSAEERN